MSACSISSKLQTATRVSITFLLDTALLQVPFYKKKVAKDHPGFWRLNEVFTVNKQKVCNWNADWEGVFISLYITLRLVSKAHCSILFLLQVNTASISEILATCCFDSITMCRPPVSQSFDVTRFVVVIKCHHPLTCSCWTTAGLLTRFNCAWIQQANTWSSIWLCCV